MKKSILFKESDIRNAGTITLKNGWNAALEFGMYAENFQAAAGAIVEELSKDETFTHSISTTASFRGYPALYLYRHALELAIKGIIIAGAELLEHEGTPINEKKFYRTHHFQTLRPDFERLIEALGFGWNFGVPGLERIQDFRQLFAELDEFDASCFRYPVSSRGTASMETERCVNVFDFATKMESLIDSFIGVLHVIRDVVDQRFTCGME